MAKSTTTYWNPLTSESEGRWTVIAEASWSDATFEGYPGAGTPTASPSVIST